MSLYESYLTNQSLERDGVYLDYSHLNFKVKIARAGGSNSKFLKEWERVMRPYQKAVANKTMDIKILENLLADTFAKTVILGWETKVDGEWKVGIEGPKGELLPYTVENVAKTLKTLPELFTDIRDAATDYTVFQQEQLEVAEGN